MAAAFAKGIGTDKITAVAEKPTVFLAMFFSPVSWGIYLICFLILSLAILPRDENGDRQWKAGALWALLPWAIVSYFVTSFLTKVFYNFVLPAVLV